MVKGYDPTKSDFSSLFMNYLFEIWNANPSISLSQSEKYVKYWLENSEYSSKIYQAFKAINIKPQIKLKKKCNLSKEQLIDEADEHFPTTSNEDEITMCLDNVRNKVELKEHLDREMTLLYLRKLHQKDSDSIEEKEKKLMEDIYESCYSGYRNYMMPEKVTKDLSLVCSKYLFFRKTKNSLPIDRLFRYTTKLSEDLLL